LPDGNSVQAAARALELAVRTTADGLLVLLSGGGSAMLAAPADGLSLDDKRSAIDALLRSGADIVQLNCVRKHLSSIKGGRLALAAREIVTLAISDVHQPEDDPATIASGPTVADPTTYADALAVLSDVRCAVPPSVCRHLERGASGQIDETPKPGDVRLAGSTFEIVGNRRTAMEGAAREARRRGYLVRIIDPATRGEAREAGRIFAEIALATKPVAGPICLIASGEPTVRVTGSGRGGRNQEFVLGAAPALARKGELALVASIGTDGVDGPTDAAGAIAASTTVERLTVAGLRLDDVLARNDAYTALDRLGDLIKRGPTGTNVGDVHVALTMRS
jgi:glycerate-2-kinase